MKANIQSNFTPWMRHVNDKIGSSTSFITGKKRYRYRLGPTLTLWLLTCWLAGWLPDGLVALNAPMHCVSLNANVIVFAFKQHTHAHTHIRAVYNCGMKLFVDVKSLSSIYSFFIIIIIGIVVISPFVWLFLCFFLAFLHIFLSLCVCARAFFKMWFHWSVI